MIYFIQDESTHRIKIGFTAGEAKSRLDALQTGNPSGLILLATIPGEKDRERQLHEQFSSYRERGEWFHPGHPILSFLIEEAGVRGLEQGKLSATIGDIVKVPKPTQGPFRIYLAGKVTGSEWRGNLLQESVFYGIDEHSSWPEHQNAVLDGHTYVGPYFINTKFHSSSNGGEEDSHGLHAQEEEACSFECKHGCNHCDYGNLTQASVVVEKCLQAVRKADLVFAWIDSHDCYGTLAELAYAKALHKRIAIGSPRFFRDMWFLYEMADHIFPHCSTPKDALLVVLSEIQMEQDKAQKP